MAFCISVVRFVPVLLICLWLAPPAASAATRFEEIARQADAARVRNRVAVAIRLYREGARLNPSWADGWWYLGSLLYDQDRFSEAAVAFQRLIASAERRGPAHAFLGLCQYQTGNYDEALAQFRSWAEAGWPGTAQLRDVGVFHFALLLTREGRFVESLFLMAPLASRLGDNPELWEAMGLASLRMRNLPQNYPPDRRERVWLAGKAALCAARSRADLDCADEFAARLELRYPAEPEVHFFRATLYGIEGKKVEAEREYRQELTISPDHAPTLVALAAIDLEKAEVAEAENLARQAAGADPNNAEAHHLLGRILLANGDLPASASELERAKQLAPDNPGVRSHLAMVYSKLGRTQEAKAESAAFLALKNKEEVMAPPKEKLGEARGKAH